MPLLVQGLTPDLWIYLQAPDRAAPVSAWHVARGDFRWLGGPRHGRTTWLPRYTAACVALTSLPPRRLRWRNEDHTPETSPKPEPGSWRLAPPALLAHSSRSAGATLSPSAEPPASAPRSHAIPSHT